MEVSFPYCFCGYMGGNRKYSLRNTKGSTMFTTSEAKNLRQDLDFIPSQLQAEEYMKEK